MVGWPHELGTVYQGVLVPSTRVPVPKIWGTLVRAVLLVLPETGAGVGEHEMATGLGAEDEVGGGSPTPLHVGGTSIGGELNNPDTSMEVQNMNLGENGSPSEHGVTKAQPDQG